jgi:crotonobetainyl-CoA:carnitine CoA-transferase CaiB-like acyl-CoA transferase
VIPFNVYKTEDRPAVLSIFDEANWDELCRLLGLEEWIERYPDQRTRQNNTQRIDDRIEEVLQSKPLDHWIDVFSESTIKIIPVNSVQEAFEHEQVKHREVVQDAYQDGIGEFKQLPFPVKFSNHSLAVSDGAPRLGEHTIDILSQCGYSPQQIDELEDKKLTSTFRGSTNEPES